MFSPVQIKQEYPVADDSNQSVVNGMQAVSEYPIFTNQDVEYMYRQLPQFWAPTQVQSHQMVHDLASKEEVHIRQQMAHQQQSVQQLAVTNYLQQQSHVMPFAVEQRHLHEPESQQQSQITQQTQPPNLSHENQEAHSSQLVMQHPIPNPGNPLLGVATASPTKHNGPGRPPKPTQAADGTTPPKKMKCQCEICFKEFGHKSNLFIHMRTHNGERPYKCTQCEKCFTHSGNLAIHMRTHSGERPYACQICGKMFSHSGNLSTHLRTHSGVKPYKCSVCCKEFRHSGNLSIHERIHSGIKPFQCKICGKEFYHSGNLTTHMKKHPINMNKDSEICEVNNDGRIAPLESTVTVINPVRLAVDVAPTAAPGIIGQISEDPVILSVNAAAPTAATGTTSQIACDTKSVAESEVVKEVVTAEESVQFAPPTS